MTKREQIITVLEGGKPDVIPLWKDKPMDVTVSSKLLPPATGNPVDDQIAIARFFDSSICSIGIWPRSETVSRDDIHHKYRYETGAVWLEEYKPTFFREALSFPVNTPEEAMSFVMCDAKEPGRFDEQDARRQIEAFHDAGYFVEGSVLGAWMGTYYYLTRFDNMLMWMAIEPKAAHALFDKTQRFSVEASRRLLECGVDCIYAPSDLGSSHSLLFSVDMFYEYVFPWLKEMSDLCHSYGSYFHLHSHGHIEKVMDGIVEAGVDVLNPVGPSDRNDLEMFKERWGDKITLHGGISTTLPDMTEDEMRAHVREVIAVGRKGGRFIPRTESGIPPMSLEKTRLYIDILQEECKIGYE